MSTVAKLNINLVNVNDWLTLKQLSLNEKKGKYMIFHTYRIFFSCLPVRIDTIIIERAHEFNSMPNLK